MKNIQKSIRMTDAVYQAIDSYHGNGFNEKLANLVMDYLNGRDQLQHELDGLQKLIAQKHSELVCIQNRVRDAQKVDRALWPLIDAVAGMLGDGL